MKNVFILLLMSFCFGSLCGQHYPTSYYCLSKLRDSLGSEIAFKFEDLNKDVIALHLYEPENNSVPPEIFEYTQLEILILDGDLYTELLT